METSLQNYAASAQTLQAKQAEHQAQVDAALEELNRLVTARNQLGWWDKLKSMWGYNRLVDEQKAAVKRARNAIARAEREHKTNQVGCLRELLDLSIAGSQRRAEIHDLARIFQAVKEIHQGNKQLVQLGEKALREIGEADAAVSSAQTMEVFDLATDNKGISLMSSMSNMDASSEMDDARRAVKEFARAAQQHQERIEALNHDMTLEVIDLGLDLFDVTGWFDVGSVLSLMSLSSASSALDDAERKVKRMLEPLRSAERASAEEYRRDKDALVSAKREVFQTALLALQERGLQLPTNETVQRVIENHKIEL